MASTGSLGSLSSDDSGCEAGSDSENQLSSSPSSDRNRKDSFGFDIEIEEEEEEQDEDGEDQQVTTRRTVKERARTLMNRVSQFLIFFSK